MARSNKWTRLRLIAYLSEIRHGRRKVKAPNGEVLLVDVDGAYLIDPEGYYLTDKDQ